PVSSVGRASGPSIRRPRKRRMNSVFSALRADGGRDARPTEDMEFTSSGHYGKMSVPSSVTPETSPPGKDARVEILWNSYECAGMTNCGAICCTGMRFCLNQKNRRLARGKASRLKNLTAHEAIRRCVFNLEQQLE